MSYAKRQDSNQTLIKDAFERLGCSVLDLSRVGIEGVPDLAVSVHKVTCFCEVKTETGKLSPGQVKWHRESKAWTEVARDLKDVERIVKEMRLRAFAI